ncbi:MAG TPA: hypothetical protein VNL34_02925 [Candidatus Nitrosotenuis sp.]|nr:hypothetical protein [Candidatus Nitrosotenuis sp.]
MNPLFQLSTRKYDEEIELVRKALAGLEEKCNVKNGYNIGEPFSKAGWTFFNVQISSEMATIIETSGMMKGALGYRIGEQLKNFLGHFLESYGSNVRITKIDY